MAERQKFKLAPELLAEAGFVSMTESQVRESLNDLYSTLEIRVGRRLARKMPSHELAKFETFIEADDEAAAIKWLADTRPGYKDEVREELDYILGRLRSAAEGRREITVVGEQTQEA